MNVLPESAEQVTIKLFAPKPLGLTGTLRTLQNLGLPVVEELSLPLVLPDNRTGFLERLRIQAAPKIISAVAPGARSPARRAARAPREARHRRCAERPGDVRGPHVAPGRGAAHAAQPPDPGPPQLQRRHDHRRDAAQQRRVGGAVPAVRCPLRSGRRRRSRSRRGSGRSRACASPCSRWAACSTTRSCAASRTCCSRWCAPTSTRRPSGRWSRSRWSARKVGRHGLAAAAVRDLRALAAPRGHPPARRQGGARRHPLERPPRRLPHRGPRA